VSARLFSHWGDTQGVEVAFEEEVTIGRDAGNSLVLDFSAVSSQHARISFDPAQDCYVVEDLGSLNGTRVDGVRAQQPMRLDRLHVLKFGRICEFVFQRLDGVSAARPAAAAETTDPAESEAGDLGTTASDDSAGEHAVTRDAED